LYMPEKRVQALKGGRVRRDFEKSRTEGNEVDKIKKSRRVGDALTPARKSILLRSGFVRETA